MPPSSHVPMFMPRRGVASRRQHQASTSARLGNDSSRSSKPSTTRKEDHLSVPVSPTAPSLASSVLSSPPPTSDAPAAQYVTLPSSFAASHRRHDSFVTSAGLEPPEFSPTVGAGAASDSSSTSVKLVAQGKAMPTSATSSEGFVSLSGVAAAADELSKRKDRGEGKQRDDESGSGSGRAHADAASSGRSRRRDDADEAFNARTDRSDEREIQASSVARNGSSSRTVERRRQDRSASREVKNAVAQGSLHGNGMSAKASGSVKRKQKRIESDEEEGDVVADVYERGRPSERKGTAHASRTRSRGAPDTIPDEGESKPQLRSTRAASPGSARRGRSGQRQAPAAPRRGSGSASRSRSRGGRIKQRMVGKQERQSTSPPPRPSVASNDADDGFKLEAAAEGTSSRGRDRQPKLRIDERSPSPPPSSRKRDREERLRPPSLSLSPGEDNTQRQPDTRGLSAPSRALLDRTSSPVPTPESQISFDDILPAAARKEERMQKKQISERAVMDGRQSTMDGRRREGSKHATGGQSKPAGTHSDRQDMVPRHSETTHIVGRGGTKIKIKKVAVGADAQTAKAPHQGLKEVDRGLSERVPERADPALSQKKQSKSRDEDVKDQKRVHEPIGRKSEKVGSTLSALGTSDRESSMPSEPYPTSFTRRDAQDPEIEAPKKRTSPSPPTTVAEPQIRITSPESPVREKSPDNIDDCGSKKRRIDDDPVDRARQSGANERGDALQEPLAAADSNDRGRPPFKKPRTEQSAPASRSRERVKPGSEAGLEMADRNRPAALPDHIEYQSATCKSRRIQEFAALWCNACISRVTGDACRFKGFRCWDIDDAKRIIGGPYFTSLPAVSSDLVPLREADFPISFNRELDDADRFRTLRSCVKPLMELLTRELRHASRPDVLHKPVVDTASRATCDFCKTTMFAGTWFCSDCGREYCLDCVNYFAPGSRLDDKDARLRLGSCRGRGERIHGPSDMMPTSSLTLAMLREQLVLLAAFAIAAPLDISDVLPATADEMEAESERDRLPGQSGARVEDLRAESLLRKNDYHAAERAAPHPEDPAQVGSHPLISMSANDVKQNSDFMLAMWSRGEPMLAHGIQPKLDWRPSAFAERCVAEACFVQDCETNVSVEFTADHFFLQLTGEQERANGVWKLKDWPTDQTFAQRFPDLWADFNDFVPAPDYTRHDGTLDVFGRFPLSVPAPDLGPKMYVAFAGNDRPGGFGSTRLHMDIADAVNVLVHASPDSEGHQGGAVWDIFRAQDASLIRDFLRERFPDKAGIMNDPIHDQTFFLDSKLRRELFVAKGVKSFRIYQREGDAVFVPAGCAHQVCNLSDCIKIATDFVSPGSVDRCQALMKEFRGLNMKKAWKDDVLQFHNTLW